MRAASAAVLVSATLFRWDERTGGSELSAPTPELGGRVSNFTRTRVRD